MDHKITLKSTRICVALPKLNVNRPYVLHVKEFKGNISTVKQQMNSIQIFNRSPKEGANETDSLILNYVYGGLSCVEKKLPWF
jgi:hypothetical protein